MQNKPDDDNKRCTPTPLWRSGAIRKEQRMATDGNHLKHETGQRMRIITNENAKTNHFGQNTTTSDDLRISRILRRLTVENNPTIAMELCKKLDAAVRSPTNAAYVCRSYDLLLSDMLTTLRQAPLESTELASGILGLMFYINRSEFGKTKHFLTMAYDNSGRVVQKYLIMALKTAIGYDATMLDLSPFADGLLVTLKDFLENATASENFIAISETIVEFSKNYQTEFKHHFTDIVDIIVGWHLEVEQPHDLKQHCATVLQEFNKYFSYELDFTFGLLGQFLEDIGSFGDEITNDANTYTEKQKNGIQFGSFVGAFTTILKSLATRSANIAFTADTALIGQALFVIVQTAKQTLMLGFTSEETVLNLNDFLCLFVVNAMHMAEVANIKELIVLEVHQMHTFNDAQKSSLLYLLLCTVRQLRTQLPRSLVTLVFHTENSNPFPLIKMTNNARLYKLLLRFYQEVLLVKNVPLLQEAYKHISRDMDACIGVLEQCNDKSNQTQQPSHNSAIAAATILNFHLAALSVLATQTSSIISMYALNPSMLELLVSNCRTANVHLWRRHPTLHNALLQLLAVHCQNNRNFIPSSELLTECGMDATPSRASGNFTAILAFLNSILGNVADICPANLATLLRWLASLLEESKEHGRTLQRVEHFAAICRAIGTAAVASKCPLETAECMQILLTYVYLDAEILDSFAEIAFNMIDSLRPKVCNAYLLILARLGHTRRRSVHSAEHVSGVTTSLLDVELSDWYKSTAHRAPLRNKYFKPLLEAIEPTTDEPQLATNQLFMQFFTRCWTLQSQDRAHEFQRAVLNNGQLLAFWVQFEAAHYCVRNKLRTSMGKPQDTFLAIEALVMQYARRLTAVSAVAAATATAKNGECPVAEGGSAAALSTVDCLRLQEKTRTLLGFLEQLEKLILNAADGCAFAIQPAEKPAKAFFRINAHTCHEWFKRINSGVCQIAYHSMESEMLVRYAETALRLDTLSSSRFEQAIIWLVRGLLSCGEPDAIRGLYAWLRAKTGKRHAWIQHAAEQASGHKEQASEGYLSVLKEITTADDGMLRQFLNEQLTECLYGTAQWMALCKLRNSFDCAPLPYSDEHLNMLERLYFGNWTSDDAVDNALSALTDWSLCDIDSDGMQVTDGGGRGRQSVAATHTSYAYNSLLRHVEASCIGRLNRWQDSESDPTKTTTFDQDLGVVIRQGLQESLRHGCLDGKLNHQQIDFLLLNQVHQRIGNNDNSEGAPPTSTPFTFDCSENGQDSGVLLKCLQWTLLFERQQRNRSNARLDSMAGVGAYQAATMHSLYLDVAASARREGNGQLCRSMLQRFFALKGLNTTNLNCVANNLQKDLYVLHLQEDGGGNLLRGFAEMAQCLHADGEAETAINVASALCAQVIAAQMPTAGSPQHTTGGQKRCSGICINMLLTMADWLALRGTTAESYKMPQMQRLLDTLPELPLLAAVSVLPSSGAGDGASEQSSLIPIGECVIGKLVHGSVSLSGDCAEAWYAFGNWCYRWGKKVVETKCFENDQQKTDVGGGLSSNDVSAIVDVLGLVGSDERVQELLSVLQRHQLNAMENVEDIIETVDCQSSESIENQLQTLAAFESYDRDLRAEKVMAIIKIWRQAQRNVYAHTYYETATRAYFKYLAIAASEAAVPPPKQQRSNAVRANGAANLSDSTFVTTTLRILRLIVKHAVGLQDVLEEGLQHTPLRPWRAIVPQLFSRLNHHEPYVRKSVSELLCRLACNQPHLVVFPAVVGAQQEDRAQESAANASPTTQLKTTTSSTSLSTSFGALLAMLSQQSPEAVLHVQLLVKELRRVTLLWDEYWTHSLSQVYTDYAPMFNQLEQEAKKAFTSAASEKVRLAYEMVQQHLANDVERLAAHTQKPAETNYERNFQERYNVSILAVIDGLRQKPVSMKCPAEAWQRLKQLYGVFQQRALRGGSGNATLKVSDLSRVLAAMKATCIAMPGCDAETTNQTQTVYIESVENAVYILPTKTRPKKITFLGSDGRRYTYLFKGHEDLHLDERIMQFLSIANSMMARGGDQATSVSNRFRALHYSVIPLGPQSGLISWVEGVTPLFGIYKKWQQRDNLLKQQQRDKTNSQQQAGGVNRHGGGGAAASPNPPPATRPSELFYAKLTPLLAEHNMKTTDPRKQWPLSALRRVLEELSKETPRNLLARELWCQATNAAAWRQSLRNYAVSMAVMSVIGYVIGLGDRHLDNVLIKLSTGEILHIDYNICFEKGKSLRVPEKVPFRMTPNFEEALGITGIEGAFRLGCEHVLRTLRKERETLLTLLEAFVYDPLVDWTVNEEGGGGAAAAAASATNSRLTTAHLAAVGIAAAFNTNVTAGQQPQRGQKDIVLRKQEHLETIRRNVMTRLVEISPLWLKSRSELRTELMRLTLLVERFVEHQAQITAVTRERDGLTKQQAMVHELQALDTAMGSHALNTVSQRYAAYQSLHVVKRRASELHSTIAQQLSMYHECLAPVWSPDATLSYKLVALSNELNVEDDVNDAPDWCESDGCAWGQRLNNSLGKNNQVITEFKEIMKLVLYKMNTYVSITRLCPASVRRQRTLAVQHERWLSQLLAEEENTITQHNFVHAIQLERQQLGLFEPEMSEVYSFLSQFFRTCGALCDEERDASLPDKYECIEIIADIRTFEQSLGQSGIALWGPISAHTLDYLIEILSNHDSLQQEFDTNNVFMQSIAVQLIQFISSTLCPSIVGVESAPRFERFAHSLAGVLQEIKSFEMSLAMDVPECMFRLFMLDTDEPLQACLSEMCVTASLQSASAYEWLHNPATAVNAAANEEFGSLLAHLMEHFHTIETQLGQLLPAMLEVLEVDAVECDYKYVMRIRAQDFLDSVARHKYEFVENLFCSCSNFMLAIRRHDPNLCDIYWKWEEDLMEYQNFIQTQLLTGLPTLYAHLIRQALLVAVKTNAATQIELSQAARARVQDLFDKFDQALRRNSSADDRRHLRSSLKKKFFSACCWYNVPAVDDYLAMTMNLFSRSEALLDIQKLVSELDSHQEVLQETLIEMNDLRAMEEYNHFYGNENAIEYKQLQQKFEKERERIQFNIELFNRVSGYVNAFLYVESPESQLAADFEFVKMVGEWQEAYANWRHSGSAITPIEVAIVELLNPEGNIDQCWIQNISGLLDEMTFAVQRKLATLDEGSEQLNQELYSSAQQLQTFIDSPLRVMLRHQLKQLLKNDRGGRVFTNDGCTPSVTGGIRELQQSLKINHTKLVELQMQLQLGRDSAPSQQRLGQLKALVSELLILVADDKQQHVGQFIQRLYVSGKGPAVTASKGGESASKTDQRQGGNQQNLAAITAGDKKPVNQNEQKRNAYAVSVWKRIRMKLEGRDPDSNARTTIAEQVDYIIREAMNPDNLSVLYEGWTPWV